MLTLWVESTRQEKRPTLLPNSSVKKVCVFISRGMAMHVKYLSNTYSGHSCLLYIWVTWNSNNILATKNNKVLHRFNPQTREDDFSSWRKHRNEWNLTNNNIMSWRNCECWIHIRWCIWLPVLTRALKSPLLLITVKIWINNVSYKNLYIRISFGSFSPMYMYILCIF